jgi:hypothetical protein
MCFGGQRWAHTWGRDGKIGVFCLGD